MKVQRWATGIVIAVALAFIVISLLGFAHAFSNSAGRCFETFASAQWPKWIGCSMAAHENLAGGLIGLAGALFAAWLAYSGAQDQLRKINEDARVRSRLREVERLFQASADLNALRLAREYLASFAKHFPEESDPTYPEYDFVAQLRQLNQRAHVYVSRSATNAPGGFGRSITIVMWRMEKLAENIQARDAARSMSFSDLREEIRSTVKAIREIISELEAECPIFEKRLENISGQVANLTDR